MPGEDTICLVKLLEAGEEEEEEEKGGQGVTKGQGERGGGGRCSEGGPAEVEAKVRWVIYHHSDTMLFIQQLTTTKNCGEQSSETFTCFSLLHYCTRREGPGLSSFLSHKRPLCFPPLCFLRCHPTPFLNTPVVHSLPLPGAFLADPGQLRSPSVHGLCES
ncbi:unnamed protein product [Pleuronectes platessa]|uniref:Uncharacterized protein n=1 Tax=Pleuronectes platessa TaxID=8262 RepID=A0A9N7Y744_PLEPL|nr:unnamed protein product [Pleuronectes platessa]